METNLLDKMLSAYLAQKTLLSIVLQNKARLSGRIKSFDSYVIVLDNQKTEIVYRHAISSITPAPAAQAAPKGVEQPRPAMRTRTEAAAPVRQKPHKTAPRPAPAPEPGINTGMKEGLLRWMQERKAK